MTKQTVVIFLLSIIIAANSYDDLKIEDLPPDIGEELKLIIKYPTALKRDCKGLKGAEVKFLLFTRDNPNVGTEIKANRPEVIDRNKKMVVIIHGWLGEPYSRNIQEMKDAYLKRYDANLLLVDWNETSWQNYSTAACEVPVPAQKVSNFLCLMSFRLDWPLSEMHVIGHSLGAHLAGVAGFNVKSKCQQQIGRVTGLDPTYPLFFRIPEKERLDASDGLFVDVMHTNPGFMGYNERCGSVDFNPNCYREQPNCLSNQKVDNSTLVVDALCAHMRSLVYMTESINSPNFVAVSCSLCPRYCNPDIISETYAIMGEDCKKVPESKNYYIATNDTPPYALGWDAYPKQVTNTKVSGYDVIANFYV